MGGDGIRKFALCGYGGLGKTQIAVPVSFEKEGQFDAIFLIQTDTTNNLATSFELIAQALGLIDQRGDTDRMVSRSLVEWLPDPRKVVSSTDSSSDSRIWKPASWLLIFDNVDNLKVLDDYWGSILEASTGSILVTSRDPLAKSDLTFNKGIDLAPMSISDSICYCKPLVPQSTGPTHRGFCKEAGQTHRRHSLGCITKCRTHPETDYDYRGFLAQYGEGTLLFELDKMEGLSHIEHTKRLCPLFGILRNSVPRL